MYPARKLSRFILHSLHQSFHIGPKSLIHLLTPILTCSLLSDGIYYLTQSCSICCTTSFQGSLRSPPYPTHQARGFAPGTRLAGQLHPHASHKEKQVSLSLCRHLLRMGWGLSHRLWVSRHYNSRYSSIRLFPVLIYPPAYNQIIDQNS